MRFYPVSGILAALILSGCAIGQPVNQDADHSSHHRPENTSTAKAVQPASSSAPNSEAFEQQMKAMQEMQQKMQAAKTPSERAALMDEHMKLMQSAMTMMRQMRGSTSGSMAGMSAMSGSPSESMCMAPPDHKAGARQPSAGAAGSMSCMMMGMHMQMERRLSLMEQMMQMMVDRDAAMPRK